jgi:hypothetical protein
MIAGAPSPFEQWAARESYHIAPAAVPSPDRRYADRDTQAAFDAWDAGCRYVALIMTESTLETKALREKMQALACAR